MRLKLDIALRLASHAAAALSLAGCAVLAGPREVEVPLETLQASLSSKFPVRQRYLELLDVSVSNPRVRLQPETGRILATVDASIAPVFLRRSFTGSFTLSGLLAIDAVRHAVVLREPRMEQLSLGGVDDGLAGQLAGIGGLVAGNVLGDVPVYRFDPEKFRYAGVQYLPTRINTTAHALVVTFEPVK